MPSTSSNGRPVLRSPEERFSFKTNCFFCGRTAKLGRKRKHDVLEVKTIGIKETILKICQEQADSWSDVVKARILHVHDLHAADAIYHQTCSVNFRTKNRCQWLSLPQKTSRGQSLDVLKMTKGQKRSWRLLVTLKIMMMSKSQSTISLTS